MIGIFSVSVVDGLGPDGEMGAGLGSFGVVQMLGASSGLGSFVGFRVGSFWYIAYRDLHLSDYSYVQKEDRYLNKIHKHGRDSTYLL